MGWTQVIDYTDQPDIVLPPPVKKQVWDGVKFVPMTLYRHPHVATQQIAWLQQNYGRPGTYINGQYWDYTKSGNYLMMDERVYTWFQMKWGTT